MYRYLLFISDVYYPSIGFDDYHSSHNQLEDAIRFLNMNLDALKYYQIVDTINQEKFNFETDSKYDINLKLKLEDIKFEIF